MAKVKNILNHLRKDIVGGRFSCNGRLPTREEFSLEYEVSKATVQKVMATLEDERFIVSRGSQGTFVNPNSPNHTDIAILIPAKEEQLTSNDNLWELLRKEQTQLELYIGKKLRYYYVDRYQHNIDDFRKVAKDASCSRLHGVIFPMMPEPWMLEPFQNNNISIVAFTDEEVPSASTVWVDYSDMFRQMLTCCRQKGCRFPAHLSNIQLPYHHILDYIKIAKKLNFTIPPHMIQGVPTNYSQHWLRHTLHTFLDCKEPMDALIINDEAFVEPVFALLLDMGLTPGKDIQLFSQRTFAGSISNLLPVEYFGFDLYEIIASCKRALDRLLIGEHPTRNFELLKASTDIQKESST